PHSSPRPHFRSPAVLSRVTHTAPSATYTLSLHDALPISSRSWASLIGSRWSSGRTSTASSSQDLTWPGEPRSLERVRHPRASPRDRKSTRLNSSHVKISYAVFCLKKNNTQDIVRDHAGTT